jgi:hypothetical protein
MKEKSNTGADLETAPDEEISSDSDSGHDENYATAGCNNTASGSQVHVWSRQ